VARRQEISNPQVAGSNPAGDANKIKKLGFKRQSMSRHVASNISKCFQRLSISRGGSVQHECDMKAPKKKSAAAKLRSWRVSIIRKRGQYIGTVEALNEKAAEAEKSLGRRGYC